MSLPNQPLFQPKQTAQALRDVAYRNESMAIAELIDNSFDASATAVDVLLETGHQETEGRRIQRIQHIAVADEGLGMDPDTLAKALSYGGRPDIPRRGSRIGKYGMGLPTASGSQCQKFEVWTCEGNGKGIFYAVVDLENLETDQIPRVQVEQAADWPSIWRTRVSDQIASSERGTIVLWSKIDRNTSTRANTIYKRLTEHVGRIYRYPISEGDLRIRVAQFREQARSPADKRDQMIRPIDPLFLIAPSHNPEERWGKEPMFEPWGMDYERGETAVTVREGERKCTVNVRYSVARTEALESDGSIRAGGTPRGRFANKLTGISIVREGRELFIDKTAGGFGGRHSPQHRWWGCEISFNADADEIFGVDYQKQAATKWSTAMTDIADLRREESSQNEEQEEIDLDKDGIRALAKTVWDHVDHLFQEARTRVSQSKSHPTTRPEADDSPETRATDLAGGAFQGRPETEVDRDRSQIPAEERMLTLTNYLTRIRIPDPEKTAANLIQRNAAFCFVPDKLSGHMMFHVENTGAGITVVKLNTEHELYDCLQHLEHEYGGKDNLSLIALLVAILSWARLSLESRSEDRKYLESTSDRWGEVAKRVYADLLELFPDPGDHST